MNLKLNGNLEKIVEIFSVLGCETRVRILQKIIANPEIGYSDIKKDMNIPRGSVLLHINKLEETGFISTDYKKVEGKRNAIRACKAIINKIVVELK